MKLENLQKSQPKPQEVLPVNTRAKDTFLRLYTPPKSASGNTSFLLGMEGKEITVANVRPVLFGKRRMICLLLLMQYSMS